MERASRPKSRGLGLGPAASGTFLGHVPAGGSAKLALVFPVELGSAFIADPERRRARILTFQQHQPFSFIEAQALLELERAQALLQGV